MIQSPLNYTGGKYRLLPQLLPLFPEQINTFVDLFCGGCNVGINVDAEHYIYNDSCSPLVRLYLVMQKLGTEKFISRVEKIIRKYHLSDVKKKGYKFYGCNSRDGLSSYNRSPYLALRNDINAATVHNEEYYIRLYVLIVYSFNNQIRFNKNGEFNLPPGKRDFNQKMQDKLRTFLDTIHQQHATFSSHDFRQMDLDGLTPDDFVYADPPYLITCASYNEQGGWSEQDERDLYALLDELSRRNIRFALSNVLESKGRKNEILKEWLEANPAYRMIELDYTYNNASYQRQNKESKTREILVINYP
ncbi:MAG: DNA adenine methylase [Lachnospiraceae bacterium]|nr:DNA adenine methylase [Lachnospiraceae bacterium]